LGIGDWGLGVGAHPPTPKPQTPNPNLILKKKIIFNKKNLLKKIFF